MTEPNEQYAYFTIAGDFDPGEISKLAEVTPTEFWRTGDVNARTKLARKFSRWSLYSRLPKAEALEDHIADVISQLDEHAPQFINLCSSHSGVMQLVGYFKTDYPGFHMDRELIERLARYGLSVDFDFYYLYSDNREDS